MTERSAAPACALAGILLVLAQDAYPQWAGFHTWEYAAALALLAVPVAGYALDRRRRARGEDGLQLGTAMLGALVIIAAGLQRSFRMRMRTRSRGAMPESSCAGAAPRRLRSGAESAVTSVRRSCSSCRTRLHTSKLGIRAAND